MNDALRTKLNLILTAVVAFAIGLGIAARLDLTPPGVARVANNPPLTLNVVESNPVQADVQGIVVTVGSYPPYPYVVQTGAIEIHTVIHSRAQRLESGVLVRSDVWLCLQSGSALMPGRINLSPGVRSLGDPVDEARGIN